ncbi:MAG: PilZ domain-containing protein [Planctomycetes bacterium]|nr:PilZ domain-containing protein [Planctomycetota bacterium]
MDAGAAGAAGADKRGMARVTTVQLVRLAQESEAGAGCAEALGRTLDLSERGVRVESDRHLPFLAEVDLSIALGEVIVQARSRIVHLTVSPAGSFHIGFEFSHVSEEDRTRLRAFLARREAAREVGSIPEGT